MTSFSSGIRQFFKEVGTKFNADLIADYLRDAPFIETQANIRTDIGDARTKKLPSKTWKYRVDGNVTFWNIRYPRNAMGQPDWDNECYCRFPFDKYLQEVGTTWFSQEGSRRFGYDIDAVWGHGKGVTDAELQTIRSAVDPIDYAEVRRSTRGHGLHLYILSSGVQVANHNEHAALGRALLGQLCLDTGLDFAPQVDCCGGNMWIASRRATVENRGFELLKPATRILTPDDLPVNWRDHIDVVTRKRSRVRVPGNEDDCAKWSTDVALDDTHKQILEAYEKTGFALSYSPDYKCWHAHTVGLSKVFKLLGLRGFFDTNSDGNDPATPNCFFFLRPNGVLFVVRFNTDKEHLSWGKTETEKACCLFNAPVDLKSACQAVGGVWTGSGATCHTFEQAAKLTVMFGFTLPPLPTDRVVNFKHQDAHTITAETAQLKGTEVVEGWGVGYRKLMLTFEVEPLPATQHKYDTVGRHLITTEKEAAGWLMRTDANEWIYDSKDTVIDRTIDHLELPAKSRTFVSGRIAADPWKLVNEPLQPEFLPGRQWNKFGAQLAVAPTYGGIHPHYDRILQHIGSGLDDAVKNDPWCQQHGILSGAQYFLIWCAVLFRDPKQHLPMLYLFSQSRDNGKSAFYKALGLLISRGFVEGVRMLNEPFNKMMAGALLVYLDEERVEGRNAQKMKLWIDNDKISLRLMRTDAFMFDNFSHWIATYNFTDGVPVEDGDERVVMVELPTLYDEDKLDWKLEMRPALEAERTDFLGTLMTMELPPSGGRLYLPVLSTPLKEKVMAGSDKSGCNLDELLARTVAVVQERGGFVGMSGEFAKLLGPGSWESSLNHLRRYLRKIEPELPRHGINADLSDARVIVLNQVS